MEIVEEIIVEEIDESSNQEMLLRFDDHPDFNKTQLKEWYKEMDVRKYKACWSWIMPLVIKINLILPFTNVEIDGKTCIIVVNDDVTFSNTEKTELDAIYKTVVEFVKWYNENK